MSSNATTNNNVRPLPSTPKAQTTKEVIAANVTLLIEQLEAGHSEGLTAYLAILGLFKNSSLGTILESARQMPRAGGVAGFYGWNQLGRKEKKRSKGTPPLPPMIDTKHKKQPTPHTPHLHSPD